MNVTTRFRAASAFFVASLLFASCGNLPPETSTETVLAAGEQRHEQALDDLMLADDHFADLLFELTARGLEFGHRFHVVLRHRIFLTVRSCVPASSPPETAHC